MPWLSDAELANLLHSLKAEGRLVENQPHPKAVENRCHENAAAYVDEHPGCTLARGWLIEEFVGGRFFIAHTVVRHADGSRIDPTPLMGQYRFISHPGTEEDFALQRHNRPRVQYPPLDPRDFLYAAPIEEPDEFY